MLFRSTLLALATAVEGTSEHPLARAFVAAAAEAGIAPGAAVDALAVVGRGIVARVGGREVAVGSERFLADRAVDTGHLPTAVGTAIERGRVAGSTIVMVAVDGRCAGFFEVSDPPRPEAAAVIAGLGRESIDTEMLSGDTPQAAAHVARLVGLDRAEGALDPAAKAERISRLRDDLRGAGSVVFVGDGINDAPALASADVGITMGTGTDIAIESAGVTLVRGDLLAIAEARRLSRATLRNIRQNLFFAFVYNVVGVPLAALGWLSPEVAGLAMAMSSVSVVSNALMLARWSPRLAALDASAAGEKAVRS